MPKGKKAAAKRLTARTDEHHLAHSTAALKQIANTLAFLAMRQPDVATMNDTDRIILLSSLGFDRSSVAAIVGTTVNTVSVRLSEAKASQSK